MGKMDNLEFVDLREELEKNPPAEKRNPLRICAPALDLERNVYGTGAVEQRT